MRGDSLRDLYAKTLALLGLGVLAGAGALVDYWPVGVSVPDTASTLDRPAPAPLLEASTETFSRASVRTLGRSPQAFESSSSAGEATATVVALPVTETSDRGLGAPVALFEPVTRTALAITPVSFEAALLTNETYASFAPLATDDGAALLSPIATSARSDSSDDEDGFITGAFKRTGSTIVRGGVKTGTSVVDAVRVLTGAVGGAVRKALPN